MTPGDIVVLGILGLVVGTIIASMRKDKQKGRCCGNCTGCSRCREKEDTP